MTQVVKKKKKERIVIIQIYFLIYIFNEKKNHIPIMSFVTEIITFKVKNKPRNRMLDFLSLLAKLQNLFPSLK